MSNTELKANQFYFVETRTKLNETVTSEEGCDSLEEVRDYLNNRGYPQWVVDSAIENLGLDDPTWNIKISILDEVNHAQANTQAFSFDVLADKAKNTALANAVALSMQSEEWNHVLSTAATIQTGILNILKGYEADSQLASITSILSTDTLEALHPFNEFDMPASTRIAVDKLSQMASSQATVAQTVAAVQDELQSEIITYWENVFRSHTHALEWLESVDMTFNQNGEVLNYENE